MKHAVKLLATGSAIAMAMTASAFAADLAQPQIIETPVFEAPERVPASMSGWYIRGDVSYNWNKNGPIGYYNVIPVGANFVPSFNGVLDGELKNSFSIGAGVGYQLNHYARVDATLDYDFKANFEGSTTGTCNANGDAIFTDCTSTDTSSYKAITLLANAYVDLGTYSGFTPYVGAGIGGARVHWSGLTNAETCVGDPTDCETRVHEGSTDWRFAYAVMAGVSYDVNHKLSLDVGYRYKHIQGGHMFGVNGNGPGIDGGITQHQIRAGLRYKFGGHKKQAAYHPTPVYK